MTIPDSETDGEADALRIATADMARLAEKTGESVALARLVDGEAVYIEVVEAGKPSGESPIVGERVPVWRTAIGKALVTGLPFDARPSLLGAIGEADLAAAGYPSLQALASHLDLATGRGWAIEIDAFHRGISGVAAPIVDGRGRPVAAIGISGSSGHLTRERLHELGPAVVEATRSASASVGGAPRPLSTAVRPAAPVSSAVNLLTDSHNLIGECPVYDADNDRLFWVDMYDPAIHRFDFGTGKRTTFHPGEMVAALALAPEGLLAAAQSGLWLLDPETCDKRRFLGDPEAQIPTNRFNDGKCDSRGRLWVDTIDLGFAGGAGALYRWDVERGFATMDTGLNVPNGMGWSPDNSTMYLADTADRTIYAYDYDEEPGALSNRRVFVRIPDAATGAPDGLAVDAAGNVWAALFDGWRISRFSPGGELTGEVVLPVPRPTSCAFGGKDGRALYVTSARIRVPDSIPEQAPNSGAVFTVSL